MIKNLVSIIVPIYNAENHLKECIESILNQSYSNIELILVDDGSKDNSLKICENYSKIDDRVVLHSKNNTGVSNARNVGIKLSRGEYINFVDSDDYIDKDMIKIMINNFASEYVDLVVTNYMLDYLGNKIYKTPRIRDGIHSVESLKHKLIDDGTMTGILIGSACFCTYKKKIIIENSILFNENINLNEDGLFNLIYLKYSKNINYLANKYLYVYRQHEISKYYNCGVIVNRFNNVNKEIEKLLNQGDLSFQKQIEARNVSIALWNILSISNKYNNENLNEKIYCIKKICSDELTIKGLNYIKIKELNIYKKIYYYLIKKKKHTTLYVITRYIYPILEKILKR